MNRKYAFLLLLMLFTLGVLKANLQEIQQPKTYNDLVQTVSALPTFRDLYNQSKIALHFMPGTLKDFAEYRTLKSVTFAQFEKVLDEFFSLMISQLKNKNAWLNADLPLSELLDPMGEEFVPYAQKLFLDPGSLLICKGDLHGDLHSLMAFIKNLQETGITSKEDALKIVNPFHNLVFHGDYVDRGIWGVEVLYVLMLLRLKNPNNVFLIRGNHEDPDIAQHYGFHSEFHEKFELEATEEDLQRCYSKISKFYNYLPIVCYVGSGKDQQKNFMQLCHGGIELGYNPKAFLHAPADIHYHWIEKFNRYTQCCNLASHEVKMPMATVLQPLKSLCKDFVAITPMESYPLGTLWHDFVVDPNGPNMFKQARGYMFNKALTEDYLNAVSTDLVKLFGILRAHQHTPDNNDPMMKLLLESQGCAALWRDNRDSAFIPVSQSMVLTLLLSPDSLHGMPNLGGTSYTGFDYDTYAMVKTGEKLSDWTIKVINNAVYKMPAAS